MSWLNVQCCIIDCETCEWLFSHAVEVCARANRFYEAKRHQFSVQNWWRFCYGKKVHNIPKGMTIDISKNRLVIRPILRPTALGTFSRELDESRDVTYLVQALNKSNSRCKKALRLQLSFSQSPCELHI